MPSTLTLTKDARGLAFSMALLDTTVGRDVSELLKRGDVAGASVGFRTIKDAWRQDGDVIVRELLDLTAFPAYLQTDVAAAKRSLQQFVPQGAARGLAGEAVGGKRLVRLSDCLNG